MEKLPNLDLKFMDLKDRKIIKIKKNGPAEGIRNTECIFYGFCLDLAVENNWDNFSCENCDLKNCAKPHDSPLCCLNVSSFGEFPLNWKIDR